MSDYTIPIPSHIAAAFPEVTRPFASDFERQAAFSDPRYASDEMYRRVVAVRLALSGGAEPSALEATPPQKDAAGAYRVSVNPSSGFPGDPSDLNAVRSITVQSGGLAPERPNPSLADELAALAVAAVENLDAQRQREEAQLAQAQVRPIRIERQDGTTRASVE